MMETKKLLGSLRKPGARGVLTDSWNLLSSAWSSRRTIGSEAHQCDLDLHERWRLLLCVNGKLSEYHVREHLKIFANLRSIGSSSVLSHVLDRIHFHMKEKDRSRDLESRIHMILSP